MGLAVDEEGHDDGDDQAHDDGDDDAHVQRHVVGARSRWGEQRPNKRILHLIEALLKKGIRPDLCPTTSVSPRKSCQTHRTTGSVSCEALQLV